MLGVLAAIAIAVSACSGSSGGKADPSPTPAFLTALKPSAVETTPPNAQTSSWFMEVDETLYDPREVAIACNPASFTLVSGGVSHPPAFFSSCDSTTVAPNSGTTAHLFFPISNYYAGKASYELYWNGGIGYFGNGGEARSFTFDSGDLGHGAGVEY